MKTAMMPSGGGHSLNIDLSVRNFIYKFNNGISKGKLYHKKSPNRLSRVKRQNEFGSSVSKKSASGALIVVLPIFSKRLAAIV